MSSYNVNHGGADNFIFVSIKTEHIMGPSLAIAKPTREDSNQHVVLCVAGRICQDVQGRLPITSFTGAYKLKRTVFF